jgi:hypothetical protein
VACSGRILTTASSPAGHNATIYECRQGSYSGFPKTYYKGGFENYEQYLEASKQVSKKPIRPLFSLLKHVLVNLLGRDGLDKGLIGRRHKLYAWVHERRKRVAAMFDVLLGMRRRRCLEQLAEY